MQVTLPNGERADCEKVALMAWDRPDAEVDRRTRALAAKTRRTYSEAMNIVLDEDEALKRAYAEQPFKASRNDDSRRRDKPEDDPDAEVHRLTELKMRATRRPYSEAMTAVLADPANIALKEAYARQR